MKDVCMPRESLMQNDILSLPLHSAMWSLEPQTAEEEEEEKRGFKIHGFNQFLSDRLPLDREVPDTRDPR